jgi:hypothetical protein
LRKEEWRVVKKRERRCGGEDVGWDVSALRSHWRTDILRVGTIVSDRPLVISG